MAPARKIELDSRLNAYCATLRASALGDALKRSVDHWPIYAAVTGAAVAMATNASASIIYSGIDVTTAVSSANFVSKNILLKNGGGTFHVSFNIVAAQGSTENFQFGDAVVNASHVDFLVKSGGVKRLSSGARISGAGNSFATGPQLIARRAFSNGVPKNKGWSETKGFAGISFQTSDKKQTDFGWVRLQYTVGSNNLIDSLTVIDWGYDNTGAAIMAGQGAPPTVPEPPTSALALLAAGAAGIAFLRRRKKISAE